MKQQGYWSKFGSAVQQLNAGAHDPVLDRVPSAGDFFRYMAQQITKSQRFYVPNATGVINRDSVQLPLWLPYPVITILNEAPIFDILTNQVIGRSWNLTVCEDSAGSIHEEVLGPDKILIYTAGFHPTHKYWGAIPCSVALDKNTTELHLVDDVMGMTKEFKKIFDAKSEGKRNLLEDFRSDADCIATLCTMLSVHNTQTVKVTPPPKLIKSRSSIRPPLQDYHVLSVGGDLWDSPHALQNDSNGGVRSHLRRGHIRRLEGRTTWVRHTFVHGSREGFVDKDYALAT